MTKHVHVMLWAPLLYCALFLVLWIRIFSNSLLEFDDLVLEKQINYAAESALGEMLFEANKAYNDQDPYSNIELDADYGMYDFCRTMCYNMGLLPTESNILLVKTDYVQAAVLAEWDGVYGWSQQKFETSGHGLVLAPKLPYLAKFGPEGRQFCLTLGHKVCYSDSGNAANYAINQLTKVADSGAASYLTEDVQNSLIVKQVSDIFNYNAAMTASFNSDISYTNTYNIEAITHGIKTPTFIVLMKGPRVSFASRKNVQSIGGAQLQLRTEYIAYDFGNTTITGSKSNIHLSGKCYAPAEWWVEVFGRGNIPQNTNTASYFTKEDAARKGYIDISFLH